jgi:hypothetical protein
LISLPFSDKDGKIDEDHSGATRFSSYVLTGGQLLRWRPEETGPREEVKAASRDSIASPFDRGVSDLAGLVCLTFPKTVVAIGSEKDEPSV